MNHPTFFVIGAAKCGTTSMCDLLGAHPDVYMTTPKEPHYFSRLTKYRELRPWYDSLFEGAEKYTAVGDGSTSYSHPHRIDFVVPRIRESLPDARFIYMVRHPVRRLESDWKMRLREERVPNSIADAVDRHASLVTFGLYWKYLSVYRRVFSDEQLLVVFLEDLAEQPERELSRVYRHIGVDPTFVPNNPGRERNTASSYRQDGPLASQLKRLPGASWLRAAVPDWAARRLKSSLTREYNPEPDWDAGALELVRGYFREDSRRLLQHCGKPKDFWAL